MVGALSSILMVRYVRLLVLCSWLGWSGGINRRQVCWRHYDKVSPSLLPCGPALNQLLPADAGDGERRPEVELHGQNQLERRGHMEAEAGLHCSLSP